MKTNVFFKKKYIYVNLDTGIAFTEKHKLHNELSICDEAVCILAGDSIDLFILCTVESAPFLQIINDRQIILLSRRLQSSKTVLIFPCDITASRN